MFRLFYLFLLFSTVSCTRQKELKEMPNRHFAPVFISNSEAGEIISNILAQQNQQLVVVDQVENFESLDNSYALVHFTTTTGSSSILIEHTYEAETLIAKKSYRCVGTGCECQVIAFTDATGKLVVDCSCTSCTMEINNI